MIKLNITKETFSKYLISIGYNYKIKQYDDFIKTIQRITQNDIKKAIQEENISRTLEKIFGNVFTAPILLLEDKKQIKKIKKEYLKELIDNSLLDLYFEEKKTYPINKSIQEDSYRYLLLENIIKENKQFIKMEYPRLVNNTSYLYTIKKCIEIDNISLTKEEKETIKKEVEEEIKAYFFLNLDFLNDWNIQLSDIPLFALKIFGDNYNYFQKSPIPFEVEHNRIAIVDEGFSIVNVKEELPQFNLGKTTSLDLVREFLFSVFISREENIDDINTIDDIKTITWDRTLSKNQLILLKESLPVIKKYYKSLKRYYKYDADCKNYIFTNPKEDISYNISIKELNKLRQLVQ